MSRQQVLALGVDGGYIRRALRADRLHRIHEGVYAVGHANLTREARWLAAVLRAGETAVLSHLSAAQLWELVDRGLPVVHVLVPGSGSRSPSGIRFHRTRRLPATDRTERDGIPVTTPHRTLLDLAGILPAERLRFAVEAAGRHRLLDVGSLVALCDGWPGRRGIGTLRSVALEQLGPVERTKSPPEARFLSRCLARGLPAPLVNHRLLGYEVDFHWPEARLVVELDTYTYHRSWAQRQRDLARDAQLQAHGYRVIRVSADRLSDDEDGAFAPIETLLGVRAGAL